LIIYKVQDVRVSTS